MTGNGTGGFNAGRAPDDTGDASGRLPARDGDHSTPRWTWTHDSGAVLPVVLLWGVGVPIVVALILLIVHCYTR